MIVIFLLSLCGFDPHPPTFCWLARFHYASMTFTSSGGFDPPPPVHIRPVMLPLHYNDLGFLCRELNVGLDRRKGHILPLDYTEWGALSSIISSGCFDQPSLDPDAV